MRIDLDCDQVAVVGPAAPRYCAVLHPTANGGWRSVHFVKLACTVLLFAATTVAGAAPAASSPAADLCQSYGYTPHTVAYAYCIRNVRQFWTTGSCGKRAFAARHGDFCHLIPPPFM